MAIIDSGVSTAGKANVDANFNLQVNLPVTSSQAGFAQGVYVANSANAKVTQTTEEGALSAGTIYTVLDYSFNSGSATWAPHISTNATTMTKAVTNGFMRLNSGAITTTATGISIYSNTAVQVWAAEETRVRYRIRHTGSLATNKQMEWGIGYYNFAAGQANGMNEFIGFRITAGGVLQGVLAYSTGGAPTETTVTANGGVPFADGVAKTYETRISDRKIEFWIDGVLQNTIAIANDTYALLKARGYPVIARVFNSGAASAAPILDVGDTTVQKYGCAPASPPATRNAILNRGTHYFQPDLLTGAGTNPFNFPASLTVPTAATGSNTASVLNNAAQLGGFFRMNGASFNVATHSNVLVAAYLNPIIPQANGAGNNGRNLVVTSISVAPQVVSTALTGGPYTAMWFATVGSTAVSLATADADGTTAKAAIAPRLIPLDRTYTFAAAAALGTIETGVGNTTFTFPTPLVVHPGEHLCIGQRLITVTAVTVGTIDGAVYVNGYWE